MVTSHSRSPKQQPSPHNNNNWWGKNGSQVCEGVLFVPHVQVFGLGVRKKRDSESVVRVRVPNILISSKNTDHWKKINQSSKSPRSLSMMALFSVKIFIICLSMASAFRHSKLLRSSKVTHGPLGVASTVIKEVAASSSAIEKPIIAFDGVERAPIKVLQVQSLNVINGAALKSERSHASKEFCVKSGGYPDMNVRNDIYLRLWASVTKQHEMVPLQKPAVVKLQLEEVEDLAAFGLIWSEGRSASFLLWSWRLIRARLSCQMIDVALLTCLPLTPLLLHESARILYNC